VLCVAGWPASGLGIVYGEQTVSLSTWSSRPRTTLGVLSCKSAGSNSWSQCQHQIWLMHGWRARTCGCEFTPHPFTTSAGAYTILKYIYHIISSRLCWSSTSSDMETPTRKRRQRGHSLLGHATSVVVLSRSQHKRSVRQVNTWRTSAQLGRLVDHHSHAYIPQLGHCPCTLEVALGLRQERRGRGTWAATPVTELPRQSTRPLACRQGPGEAAAASAPLQK